MRPAATNTSEFSNESGQNEKNGNETESIDRERAMRADTVGMKTGGWMVAEQAGKELPA